VEKVIKWLIELLKELLPAARRDPFAATLVLLSVPCEVVALSAWQYWGASIRPWDFLASFFVLLLLLRQRYRKWTEASLILAGAVVFLAILVYFCYAVPFRRLSITAAEFLAMIVVLVRCYP
jgi:hypothetical protein